MIGNAQRQPPREPGRHERPWQCRDTRRRTAAERGYDSEWQRESVIYRKLNPLCVSCLLSGRVRPSQCVDHIVPIHSCPDLKMEVENWAALCFACHCRKTRLEPRPSWTPRHDRIVVCGLPGTGKTTWTKAWAAEHDAPYWDADERPELQTIDAIQEARARWIDEQRGACVVIVASITTASVLAARLRGVVKHMTERHADRSVREV